MEFPGWMPVTVYAIVALGMISAYTWNHLDNSAGRKQFVVLAVLVILQLATDFISRFYIYNDVPHWLIVASTYVNFLVLPAIGVAWQEFVCTVLAGEARKDIRMLSYSVYAFAIIGVLALAINPFTGVIFSFDVAGIYHRGPLYFVPAASAGLCILVSEGLLLSRLRVLGPNTMFTLLTFPIPPIIGAVIAAFVYGIPWMPLGISLSMLLLFASMFSSGMNTDYLTRVINRRRIEELLEERIEGARSGKPFAGLMVDIDNFKEINDTLGHVVGDVALAETAQLLQQSLRGVDVVGRYGGDEFFALLDVSNEDELERVVARIRDNEIRLGSEERTFPLRLSKGYAMFDPVLFPDSQSFESCLDALMYANKEAHRLESVSPSSEG